MSDLTDIVNLATQAVKILDSNETQNMGQLASALPRGIDPMTATGGNWQRVARPATMTLTWKAKYSWARDDDVLTLGVVWTFGGSIDGKGQFIKDAEAFVNVGHITSTFYYDVTVRFAETGTPVGPEPIAMLTGTVNVRSSRIITGLQSQSNYGIKILGNGAGEITTL